VSPDLDKLFSGEVACWYEECPSPTSWVGSYGPCGHVAEPVCGAHRAHAEEGLGKAFLDPSKVLACARCGMSVTSCVWIPL